MNPDTIAAVVLGLVACGVSFWATTAYLRDLRIKAEADRRRKDRASWLAFMAHEQRRAEQAADEANLAVADAFRVAMQREDLRTQVARIRGQIAANHEKALAEFRDEIDQYSGGAA